jgi:drug/metabolite transporter (DMT)-like permease
MLGTRILGVLRRVGMTGLLVEAYSYFDAVIPDSFDAKHLVPIGNVQFEDMGQANRIGKRNACAFLGQFADNAIRALPAIVIEYAAPKERAVPGFQAAVVHGTGLVDLVHIVNVARAKLTAPKSVDLPPARWQKGGPQEPLMSSKSSRSFEIIVKAAPVLFVLSWSTGFVSNKFALPHIEPLTFVSVRLFFAALAITLLALALRAPLPRGRAIAHSIVSGILVHGMYLTGVCLAMWEGMPAGIAALVVGLQPVLTSTLANRFLGERVSALQWGGLVLGLIGLWLVVQAKVAGGTTLWGWSASVGALVGITVGTLYQKRFGGGVDFLSSMPIQYAAACVFASIGAFALETRVVDWAPELIFTIAWLVIVLSGAAIVLLYIMIRRSAATRVASLFYLTPAVTAVMSWLLFNEQLGLAAIAGMVLCAAGVLLVNWKATTAGS